MIASDVPRGMLQAEADRMALAEKLAPLGDLQAKVIESDDWTCRICGGNSRTCECDS